LIEETKTLIDREYPKKCNIWKLSRELVDAGFLIEGVSYDEGRNVTTVHLKDEETKDPTSIVEAHVYVEPKTIDWEKEFTDAMTVDQQLKVLAKRIGILRLTDQEVEEGRII